MGIYINKGNEGFQSSLRSEYVDKTGLIALVNKTLNTRQRFSCVTRSRRFGKTMAAEMLLAYYDMSCDSRSLFTDLEIAVKNNKWEEVVKSINQSERLLEATLRGNSDYVAKTLDAAHTEHTSILSYNDENSLACVISLAYYYARNDYHIHREYPTGEGYADLVLIPRKNVSSPALVIELKYDKDTQAAISQIKNKNYPQKITDYTGDILLVGINYDKNTKHHECQIERWRKE